MKIKIPFLGTNEEILTSISTIINSYLADWEIVGSEIILEPIQYSDNGITKDGHHKSGVEIIFEKRKLNILDPIINELNKKFGKKINQIEGNSVTINNKSKVENIFPFIDYEYWMDRNPFYSDAQLLPTMKICIINYASKPGLINDVLKNIEKMSCKNLVSIIESEIKEIIKNKQFEDKNKILRIFDLINGWGGKMGKATYVKPKGNTTRNSSDSWYKNYVNGVKKAINGDDTGLLEFKKIENVGDSFGTKHLYFWSLFGGGTPIPIYDNRIKTLLYFRENSYPEFNQYVLDMNIYAKTKNITMHQLEKALFAFSSNYYPNEELNIKDDFRDNTNYEEASRLEDLYNSNN